MKIKQIFEKYTIIIVASIVVLLLLPILLFKSDDSGILGANPLPADNYDTFLTAPLTSSATTTYVNALPGVSSTIYTIFANDGTTPSEKIYCTGTATSPNRLTYCTRGISFNPVSGVIDETAGTGKSHSKNARVAITDNINFSGKALAILNGSQATGNTVMYIGTTTAYGISLDINGPTISTGTIFLGNNTTSKNKCVYANNGDANEPKICYNESLNYWQWSDDGVNTYNFTTSSASGLSASSTRGIGITNSFIHINASTTLGMAFGADGYLYQITSSTGNISSNSNGLYLDGTDALTWTGAQTFNSLFSPSSTFTNIISAVITSSTLLNSWLTTTTINNSTTTGTSTIQNIDILGNSNFVQWIFISSSTLNPAPFPAEAKAAIADGTGTNTNCTSHYRAEVIVFKTGKTSGISTGSCNWGGSSVLGAGFSVNFGISSSTAVTYTATVGSFGGGTTYFFK